jgi:hypothetical protein
MSNCYNSELPIGPPGPQGPAGPQGAVGPAGAASAVTVKDDQGNVVTDATEIRFTDANALVTDLGSGIAEVNFVPPATVWNDVQNLAYYDAGTTSFRPQYTIEGNKITFRGLLYVPLESGGNPVTIFNGNSYKNVLGVTLDESNLTIVNNANSVGTEKQGRFFTPNVVAQPNLPLNATPINRDITFSNVNAFRRYTAGSSSSFRVAIYRTVVTLVIGCNTTVWRDPSNDRGIGCILMLSPYQDEYEGGGASPLGNDPLAFLISRATTGVLGTDYVNALDDDPFTIPATDQNNPFSVNAHNVNNLGGFIINLEGLSGYIN